MSPLQTWICPKCRRRVPGTIAFCRCGWCRYRRTEVAPGRRERSWLARHPAAWVMVPGLVLALVALHGRGGPEASRGARPSASVAAVSAQLVHEPTTRTAPAPVLVAPVATPSPGGPAVELAEPVEEPNDMDEMEARDNEAEAREEADRASGAVDRL